MTQGSIIVRRAVPNDIEQITAIFRQTVLEICSRDYNDRQIAAWVDAAEDQVRWLNKINRQYFVVAISDGK